MKRLLIASALCVFFSLPSFAQANEMRRYDINWNILSYLRQGGTDYAGGSLEFGFHATDHWAIVADAGVHTTVLFGEGDVTTYRFGPRYSSRHGKRLTTFVDAMAGGARITDKTTLFIFGPTTTLTTTSVNGFSFGAGGGFDVGIRPWIAWRAVQAQYSFIRISGANSSGIRVGTGLVFRFGK